MAIRRGGVGDPPAVGVLVDGAGLGEVAEDLSHEERVAVGLAVQGVGQTRPPASSSVWPAAASMNATTPVSSSPVKLDPADALLSPQCGQGSRERMGAARARCRDTSRGRERRSGLFGHHVAQQLQARLVRPLQVVEHQHDGLCLRHLASSPTTALKRR